MSDLHVVPAVSRPSPRPRPVDAFRRMLQLARPEWRLVGAATVFLFIGSGAQLIFPKEVGRIIDQAVAVRDQHAMDRTALAMFAIFAVMGVAVCLRYILFTIAGERVVARLRADLFEKLVEQEVGFFDERRTGELTNRLASDTAVLQNTVSANISMGLRHLATIVGGLSFLAFTSWRLTLLMLVVVPPVAVGAMTYGRRVRRLSREVQDTLAKSSEVAEETLSGIRTVRSFVAEKAEAGRYRQAVMKSFDLARHRAYVAGVFMGVAQFFGFGAVVVVLWFGSRMVLSGQLTLGGLTSFLMYTIFVAASLGAYSELWAEFSKAAGAGERVFELLDRVPRMPASGGATLPHVRGEVRFESVAFNYPARPDVPVLQGIELAAASGEKVALVGPSGAGKSTIAALIARLYDPASGRVLLDGQDLRVLDPQWLRQQVGSVAQEPILFSCSIEENIRYARPTASDAEVEAAARTANAHEFVSRFPEGYRTLVGERGVQLSGGQKQRIAIARAVLKNPRVLILDEATSALDAESEHLVKEALERLMKGRTTLIIAHRLSTVIDADRVLVLEGGKVVQSGSHSALMGQDGLYKRLVERQFVAA